MYQYRRTQFQAFFVSSILCTSVISAPIKASVEQYFAHSGWQPIATLTGGVAINSNAGANNHFPSQTNLFSFYNYDSTQSTQTQAYYGGFVGLERQVQSHWLMQLGIGYYEPSTFNAKGYVTQGADVESENQYAYRYAVKSHQLLAETKVLYNDWNQYHPYVAAGIGGSWNNAKNFRVDIDPPFTTYSNQFSNRLTASFSYAVGLGMDVNFSKNTRIGVGYRFTDVGKAATGSSMIDDVRTTYALSQSHLYVNALVAQFSFDFL